MCNFKYIIIFSVLLILLIRRGSAVSEERGFQRISKTPSMMKLILRYLTIREYWKFIQTNTDHHVYFTDMYELMFYQYHDQFIQPFLRDPILPQISLADVSTWKTYHLFFARYPKLGTPVPDVPFVFFQPSVDYPRLTSSSGFIERYPDYDTILTFFHNHQNRYGIKESYSESEFRFEHYIPRTEFKYSLMYAIPTSESSLPVVYDLRWGRLHIFFPYLKSPLQEVPPERHQFVFKSLFGHSTTSTARDNVSLMVRLWIPALLVFIGEESIRIERILEWRFVRIHFDTSISELLLHNIGTGKAYVIIFDRHGIVSRIKLFKRGFGQPIEYLPSDDDAYSRTNTFRSQSMDSEYSTAYAFYYDVEDVISASRAREKGKWRIPGTRLTVTITIKKMLEFSFYLYYFFQPFEISFLSFVVIMLVKYIFFQH